MFKHLASACATNASTMQDPVHILVGKSPGVLG